MFPTQAKIEAKSTHNSFLSAVVKCSNFNAFCKQRVKIIQSFANEKIIFSMVVSIHKWFLVPCFLFLVPSLKPAPIESLYHPYYISVIEINHNQTDKTLEISCKIFTNDFETTLEKNYKTKVDLVNPPDKSAMDKLVSDYIKKHLSIRADNKTANLSYVGFEKEEEAVYSYFQVDHVPTVKKIDVTNSILHDFSDQQINIIHCTVGGKR